MYFDFADVNDSVMFCVDLMLREARKEDRLVKQLFYVILSAYTNNPLNLAVNAPTGVGKSHVINKVLEYFPKADVVPLAGMSEKALFHRAGILVVKNESGDYKPIDESIKEIDDKIEENETEIKKTTNSDLKKALQSNIKDLEKEKEDLLKNAKKLIDLSHKVLIFFDSPRPEFFAAIMSLLSHDRYEIEYEYVDTHNGIKTRTNILRGWPAVIFAQAIDYSNNSRYDEIQRRFIITNPKDDNREV